MVRTKGLCEGSSSGFGVIGQGGREAGDDDPGCSNLETRIQVAFPGGRCVTQSEDAPGPQDVCVGNDSD